MKFTIHLLLVFALQLSVFFASAQESPNPLFFGGDSLKGFDNNLAYATAVSKGLKGMELKNEVRHRQAEFVRSKYHLIKPVQQSVPPAPLQINSTCTNLDFESGTFNGWAGVTGYNANSQNALTVATQGVSTLGVNSAETSCAYLTLVTPSLGLDPYSGIPVVDPASGGGYAVRMGGENINLNAVASGTGCTNADTIAAYTYSSGEYIQQTMAITSSNALLTYHYMVVLSSSNHDSLESPYFRVELLDQAGNVLSKDYFVSSIGSAAPTGFLTSPKLSSNYTVYYCPWTVRNLNLTPYIGMTITLRFTAAGCLPGGHFAYAYIDANCNSINLQNTSGTTCQGDTAVFTAPGAGKGGTYQWKTMPSGTAGIVGATNTQTVAITASGTYEVLVSPSGGTPYPIDTTLTFNPSPTLTLNKLDASCGACGDGTASATVTGGNPTYTYSWSPAVAGGQGTANITATPGTYTCYVTTSNGCTTSGTVIINFATGLSAGAYNSTFSVSPNPFGNTLKVELGTGIKEATLIVYDLVGKEVLHEQMNAGAAVLNTAGFAPGVYLLSVKSTGGNYLRKIIRQ